MRRKFLTFPHIFFTDLNFHSFELIYILKKSNLAKNVFCFETIIVVRLQSFSIVFYLKKMF